MDLKQLPEEVTFHYVKNDDYKTVFTSGAIGGINVQGLIHMNLFLDRPVIPRKVVHPVQGNLLGEEIDREARDGAIREIQFGAIFDIATAKNLVLWLTNHIQEIEKIQQTNKF